MLPLFEAKVSNWLWIKRLALLDLDWSSCQGRESFLIGKKGELTLACVQEMRIKHATYKAIRTCILCVICGENDSIQSLQRLDRLCLTFKLTNCILPGQRMFEPIVNHRKFQLRAILHERGFSICIDKYDIVRAAGNFEYVNYIVSIYCRHKSTRGKSSLYTWLVR